MTDPIIGAGICYYGSTHRAHRASVRGLLLEERVPTLRLSGCAYPEIARAEVARDAMRCKADCVVYIDPDIVFNPADVRKMALRALEFNAVVTATAGMLKKALATMSGRGSFSAFEVKPQGYNSNLVPDMAFAAVPLSIFEAIATTETREYTNSAIVDTGFSKGSRPFFSPWLRREGTLETPPISPGFYSNPDRAFLHRVKAAGFGVLRDDSVSVRCLSGGSDDSIRVTRGNAALRKMHDINLDYAVCVPCFGALDLEQQDILLELERSGMTIVELYDCPYIDMARSVLTRIALDALNCDGVFFLDHDIIFKPRDLIKLCEEAEERQDVVSGMYCMRKTAHSLIGAVDVPQDTEVGFFNLGKIYPALYSGLGFAAIPRKVIDSLRSTFPELNTESLGVGSPFYALDCNGNFYSGEDASFCARVHGLAIKTIPGNGGPNGYDWDIKRSALNPTGHQVWVDTSVRIFHKGSYCYGIEDHSLAVPRYDNLKAVLKSNRAEAREFFRTVDTLEPEALIRAQGLDEGADAPHGALEEK